eukprot:56246-Pyramimonas_sp.AAC.1
MAGVTATVRDERPSRNAASTWRAPTGPSSGSPLAACGARPHLCSALNVGPGTGQYGAPR